MNYRKPGGQISIYVTAILAILVIVGGCSGAFKYRGARGMPVQRELGWTMPGYDANNSGFVDRNVNLPLKLKWKLKTSAAVTGGIVGNEHFVITGDLAGNLYLIDANTGRRLSRRSHKGAISAPPMIADSLLFFATNTRVDKFGSLNLMTGEMLWERQGYDFGSGLATDGENIYIGDGKGTVSAWTISGGARKWSSEVGSGVSAGCVFADSIVLTATFDGDIYALNHSTGAIIWSTSLNMAVMGHITVQGSQMYCAGLDSTVYVIDLADGSTLWKFKAGGAIRGGVSVAEGVLYFGSNDGYLYAVDIASRRQIFKFNTGDPIVTAPLATRNSLAVGSLSGLLYVVDRFNGDKLFEFDTGSPIVSRPVLIGEDIIVSCEDRTIYAFEPE